MASPNPTVELAVEIAALRADAAKAVALSTIELRTKRGEARCARSDEAAAGSPNADESTDDGDADAEALAEENALYRVDPSTLAEKSIEDGSGCGGKESPNAVDAGEDELDHDEGADASAGVWRSRCPAAAETAKVSGSVSSVGMANAGGSSASADGDGGGLYDAAGSGDPDVHMPVLLPLPVVPLWLARYCSSGVDGPPELAPAAVDRLLVDEAVESECSDEADERCAIEDMDEIDEDEEDMEASEDEEPTRAGERPESCALCEPERRSPPPAPPPPMPRGVRFGGVEGGGGTCECNEPTCGDW